MCDFRYEISWHIIIIPMRQFGGQCNTTLKLQVRIPLQYNHSSKTSTVISLEDSRGLYSRQRNCSSWQIVFAKYGWLHMNDAQEFSHLESGKCDKLSQLLKLVCILNVLCSHSRNFSWLNSGFPFYLHHQASHWRMQYVLLTSKRGLMLRTIALENTRISAILGFGWKICKTSRKVVIKFKIQIFCCDHGQSRNYRGDTWGVIHPTPISRKLKS